MLRMNTKAADIYHSGIALSLSGVFVRYQINRSDRLTKNLRR